MQEKPNLCRMKVTFTREDVCKNLHSKVIHVNTLKPKINNEMTFGKLCQENKVKSFQGNPFM